MQWHTLLWCQACSVSVPSSSHVKIPTPHLDREGHFLSRADVQARVLGEAAFIDLEDLPSNAFDTRKAGVKIKAMCDENASQAAGIRR